MKKIIFISNFCIINLFFSTSLASNFTSNAVNNYTKLDQRVDGVATYLSALGASSLPSFFTLGSGLIRNTNNCVSNRNCAPGLLCKQVLDGTTVVSTVCCNPTDCTEPTGANSGRCVVSSQCPVNTVLVFDALMEIVQINGGCCLATGNTDGAPVAKASVSPLTTAPSVTYSINPPSSDFSIDTNTGIISLNDNIFFDTQTTITVVATSTNGQTASKMYTFIPDPECTNFNVQVFSLSNQKDNCAPGTLTQNPFVGITTTAQGSISYELVSVTGDTDCGISSVDEDIVENTADLIDGNSLTCMAVVDVTNCNAQVEQVVVPIVLNCVTGDGGIN